MAKNKKQARKINWNKIVIAIVIALAIFLAIYFLYIKTGIPNDATTCPEKNPSINCFPVSQEVCGNDGVTYKNGCFACHHGNAVWYIDGACK